METQSMTDRRPNRRQLLKKAGILGATAALLSPTAAFAQNTKEEGPEGSWLVTYTITSGPPIPTYQALITYAAGGGLVETEQLAANPQHPGSPAHGAWASNGARTFASTYVGFAFDGKGNLIGRGKVRETVTLDEAGDAYQGSGTLALFDLNGNQLFSGTFTSHATRIRVETV